MKSIMVYDIEAKKLETLADRNDTTVAEVIEMLIEYVDDMKRDNGLK